MPAERETPTHVRTRGRIGPLGREPIAVPIEDVYRACAPLVEASLGVLDETLREAGCDPGTLAGIYAVGGASTFPLVYRMLREAFGHTRTP